MIAPVGQIVALAELYCGAVEVGVGLIPGAGGNLRVLSTFSRDAAQEARADDGSPEEPSRLSPLPRSRARPTRPRSSATCARQPHRPVAQHQIAMAKQTVLDAGRRLRTARAT